MNGQRRPNPCKSSSEASLAAAYYADKEAWKRESGNRYTPEELREMERRWDILVKNPDRPHCCVAD